MFFLLTTIDTTTIIINVKIDGSARTISGGKFVIPWKKTESDSAIAKARAAGKMNFIFDPARYIITSPIHPLPALIPGTYVPRFNER